MRFYSEPTPNSGDERIKTFFAWFPVTIGHETRWLEKVIVKQSFHIGYDWHTWFNCEFVDKDHENNKRG